MFTRFVNHEETFACSVAVLSAIITVHGRRHAWQSPQGRPSHADNAATNRMLDRIFNRDHLSWVIECAELLVPFACAVILTAWWMKRKRTK